ncbi:hypothetical protein ACQPZP_12610 [Spirillospora sp. CA-142024]|uniref:hypothetical protein n=1 Tax=Spirillospora sp. CA-142024 TaxID=3240036 RepID=UPI003D8F421F
MKIVVQVKLMPDAGQAPALERTLHMVNECANWVSAASFEAYGLKGSVKDLRSMAYGELKARGLGAQAAQHVIKRVVDAYTTLRANIRAGNLGVIGPSGAARPPPSRSCSVRMPRTPTTTGACRGTTTPRPYRSGRWTGA